MSKIVSAAIAVAILLAGSGVFYHYVFFLPQVEARKNSDAEEKRAEEEKAKKLANINEELKELYYKRCMADASENYNHDWDRSCNRKGLAVDCALPSGIADAIGKTLHEAKDRCLAEARAGVTGN